jgi:hypothetical protein
MGIIKYSIADVLFSKVQQRVLRLLFGQPDRSFYTNEIIRLTHSGTGAVQRELAKLESVGLITMKQAANQKLYQVNRDAHLFSELRSIVLKTFGLVDVLLEALKPVASQIQIAFIYGSIARHEDKVSSDIDLMLIGNNLNYAELYPLLESAQVKLWRQVNPTYYTIEEWARKHKEANNFISQVIKQPKIFLIGTEDDLI